MIIKRESFINLHKYTFLLAAGYYLAGVFLLKRLDYAIFVIIGVILFNLFHLQFYQGRPKLAAVNWILPVIVALLTANQGLAKATGSNLLHFFWVLLLSMVPMGILFFSLSSEKVSMRKRIPIIKVRIIVQLLIFMLYLYLSAYTWIIGGKSELFFWGMVNVFTVALAPFFFGRILCGWICPNATLQDALYKNLSFQRPITKLPEVITSQSETSKMWLSGKVDRDAPYLPFTLLVTWFVVFFLETVFDLTPEVWYPLVFAYGLFSVSLIMPWRKFCTYFCWLSAYRSLAAQNSFWRLHFNRNQCKNCKTCLAETACPFYIDIHNLNDEMPATCCNCFACMDACPQKGVITFNKPKKVEL